MLSGAPLHAQKPTISIDEDWIYCPITAEVLNQPVMVTCCQKLFEKDALATLINTHKPCPCCRAETINTTSALKLHVDIINKTLTAYPELVKERHLTAPLLQQLIEKNEPGHLFVDAIAPNKLQKVAAAYYLERSVRRLAGNPPYAGAVADAKAAQQWDASDATEKGLINALHKNKQYPEALQRLSQMLTTTPNDNALRLIRAEIHLKQLDFAACKADCDAIIQTDSDCALAFRLRGQALFNMQQYRQSSHDLERAIKLSEHRRPKLEFYLGHCHAKLGEDNKGAKCFSRAIQGGYKKATSLMERANCYLELQDFNKAHKDVELSYELEKSTSALLLRANIFLAEKKYENALSVIDQAQQLDPSRTDCHLQRANIYKEQKKIALARAEIERYFATGCAATVTAYELSAEIYILQEKKQLAIVDFTSCIRLEPDTAHFYLCRAMQYAAIRQHDLCMTDLQSVISIEPTNLLAYELRARENWAMGNYPAAVRDYETIISLCNDANAIARCNWQIFRFYLNNYNYRPALDKLNAAMQHPDYKTAENFKSRAEIKEKLLDPTALFDYEEVLKHNPNLATIKQILRYFENNLLFARQKKLAETSLQKYRTDAQLFMHLGKSQSNLGELNESLVSFRKIIELNDDPDAWAQLLLFSEIECMQNIERISQAFPDHTGLRVLKMIYDRTDIAECEYEFDRFLKIANCEAVYEPIITFYFHNQDYFAASCVAKDAALAYPENLQYLKSLLEAQLFCGNEKEADATFARLIARVAESKEQREHQVKHNLRKKMLHESLSTNGALPPKLDSTSIDDYEIAARTRPTIALCQQLFEYYHSVGILNKQHLYLRRLRQLDPNNAFNHTRKIVFLLSQWKCELALNYAKDLLSDNKVQGADYCMVGCLYNEREEHALATQYFRTGFEMDARNKLGFETAYLHSAWMIEKTDPEYLTKLETNLAIKAHDPIHSHYLLGQTYHELGSYDKAVREFSKIINSPMVALLKLKVYLGRAEAYLKLNKIQEARMDWKVLSTLKATGLLLERYTALKINLTNAIHLENARREATLRLHSIFPAKPDTRPAAPPVTRSPGSG